MKHLKLYEGFRPIALVYSDIGHICQEYYIENYTINEDFTIDVDGDVDLCDCNNQIPFPDTKDKLGKKLPLKFNIVNGEFYCHSNQLTTLEGSPKKVSGSFDCRGNNLTSLKGGPIEVGGKYNCSRNKLTTLEGAPQKVGRWFNCSNNELVSLEGGPIEVGEFYDCAHNKLVNLIGSPKEVASFIAYYNQLSSLQGAPKYVNNFNIDITYLPKIIYGKYLKEIIKWQGEYNIYRKDGSLDEERFEDMMIDIKNDVDK